MGTCQSTDHAGNAEFVVALGNPADTQSLSQGQLTKAGGHHVDAATEPANRQVSGGRQPVGRGPADSQQLRGSGHREQKGQIVEHVVFQFSFTTLRRVVSDKGLLDAPHTLSKVVEPSRLRALPAVGRLGLTKAPNIAVILCDG